METYKVIIQDDGIERWLNEAGELHRVGKPAYINPTSGYESYWFNGQRHREDGPAIIWGDGIEFYYFDGISYSKKEWQKLVSSTQSCAGKIVEIDGKKYRLEEVSQSFPEK